MRRRGSRQRLTMTLAALTALLAALTTAASPAGAEGDRSHHGTQDRRQTAATIEAAVEVSGHECEVEVVREWTTRRGVTVTRTRQTGQTTASVGLLEGSLTAQSVTVVGPNGQGRVFGSWTLQPTTAEGELVGWFSGEINDGVVAGEHKARGRGAQAGVKVQLTTAQPVGTQPDAACASAVVLVGTGVAQDRSTPNPAGAVVIVSNHDFATTLANLVNALDANPNLNLVSTVDHQAGAASRGLALGPTTEVFFGNPAVGTPLMQAAQTTGIDLPQKMIVWEDPLGVVRVAYNAPAYLQSRHGIEGADAQLNGVAAALAALAGAATGTDTDPVFDAGQVGAGEGLLSVPTARTADEAAAAIEAALAAAPPINVVFTLDHDGNAATVGLELEPTKLIVFGNPSLGTQLMRVDQSVALDLPQKFLVLTNADGATSIVYNDPGYVADRHGIAGVGNVDKVVATINGALANFAAIGG